MHLKPITYNQADPTIKSIYQKIEDKFGIVFVPLFFQIIANFPDYFFYLWKRVEANLNSNPFNDAYSEIIKFADSAIEGIYTPSKPISEFVFNLDPIEKESIGKTVGDLKKINAKLAILTIALRENLKGLAVGAPKLTGRIIEQDRIIENEESIFERLTESEENKPLLREVKNTSKALLPLTGSKTLVVSSYPNFFLLVEEEMKVLLKTENYLKIRLLIEEFILALIDRLNYPLESSYKEFLQLTSTKPYFDELVYLLTDAFPSSFPHLVFTSALMNRALAYKNSGQTGCQSLVKSE